MPTLQAYMPCEYNDANPYQLRHGSLLGTVIVAAPSVSRTSNGKLMAKVVVKDPKGVDMEVRAAHRNGRCIAIGAATCDSSRVLQARW